MGSINREGECAGTYVLTKVFSLYMSITGGVDWQDIVLPLFDAYIKLVSLLDFPSLPK